MVAPAFADCGADPKNPALPISTQEGTANIARTIKSNAVATWPKSILKDLDSIVTVLMAAFMLVRSRAAASGSPIMRALAWQHERASDASLSNREVAVLRGSMRPQARPPYAPAARLEIVQIMRLRRWSIQAVSKYFAIHPNTLRAWLNEMNLYEGESRLFKPPINRISEAGRWLVHQIRESCPSGTRGTRTAWYRTVLPAYSRFPLFVHPDRLVQRQSQNIFGLVLPMHAAVAAIVVMQPADGRTARLFRGSRLERFVPGVGSAGNPLAQLLVVAGQEDKRTTWLVVEEFASILLVHVGRGHGQIERVDGQAGFMGARRSPG